MAPAYPNDWKATGCEIKKKYTDDIGCPEGGFVSFNIDATVNSAMLCWLVVWTRDFTRRWRSPRAGAGFGLPPLLRGHTWQVLGYKNIRLLEDGLQESAPLDFKYTTMSKHVYTIGLQSCLESDPRNGGSDDQSVYIKLQQPKPVRLSKF